MTSYTVSGVPGVSYYITVLAVNAVGPGPISDYSIVNGEINKIFLLINNILKLFIIVPLLITITATQLCQVYSSALCITNQDTSTTCKFILFVHYSLTTIIVIELTTTKYSTIIHQMSCSTTQVAYSQMPSSTTQVNYSQTASSIVQSVGGSSSTVIGELSNNNNRL